MKLIFFIGFGCFCFNQVILTSTDEIENGNIPEEIFKSNELCSQMDSKTQLMDLNVDCQLLALKQLDFVSLLSLAETNHHFKSLVSLFLKQMFQKKWVDIVIRWPVPQEIVGDYIKIKNLTIAEQLFKNFGHLIQKLKINRDYPEKVEYYRSIYKLVNLHCSKTLKEIRLVNYLNNFFDEFTNQFENVQNVYIRNILKTERRLNEVFPSVRRLHFHIFGFLSTDSINVKYTNLEHLKMCMNANEGPLTEDVAAELFRKNSHIQSLELKRASPKLIKIAADSLPQLERLKLVHIQNNYNNESISFPKVKIFEMEGFVGSWFLNTKFGNVEEFSISGKYGLEVETILQLIENNKQLEKLQIIFSFYNDREFTSDALSRKIGDKWYMEAFLGTIILKKKHNLL